MALETPIVAMTSAYASSLKTECRRIVPPGDRSADGAIESLLADRARAAAMAANARRRVENELSFESRVRRVEAIYEEIAANA
jgi:glycosyltransferase involved in cell wall biosynthesis